MERVPALVEQLGEVAQAALAVRREDPRPRPAVGRERDRDRRTTAPRHDVVPDRERVGIGAERAQVGVVDRSQPFERDGRPQPALRRADHVAVVPGLDVGPRRPAASATTRRPAARIAWSISSNAPGAMPRTAAFASIVEPSAPTARRAATSRRYGLVPCAVAIDGPPDRGHRLEDGAALGGVLGGREPREGASADRSSRRRPRSRRSPRHRPRRWLAEGPPRPAIWRARRARP